MKKYLGKTGLVLITIFICLLMFETGLRVAGEIPSNMVEGYYVPHGDSYRLRKNLDKLINWPCYIFKAYTNSLGFRDSKTGDKLIEHRKYDIFLGDSATFGNGVDYEKSFVGIYEELIKKHGMKSLNLGIAGHHFPDQKELLIEFTSSIPQKPFRVFICITPNLMANFNWKIDHIIVKDGYLFPKKNWVLPYIRASLSNTSAAYCFIRNKIRTIQANTQDPDALIMSQLEYYLDRYSKENPLMKDEELIKGLKEFYDSINQYCYNIDAEPVYVFIPLSMSYKLVDMIKVLNLNPDNYDTYYYSNFMEEYCKSRNLQLINLKSVLLKYYNEGMELMFELDAHYTAPTNKIVGEYIYTQIYDE